MRPFRRSLIVHVVIGAVGLVSVAPASASFAVTEFTAKAVNEDGTLDTQAGSHPYEAITSFTFNQAASGQYPEDTAGNVKNIEVELPPGFIGNPQATPMCSEAVFNHAHAGSFEVELCPPDTQVGTSTVVIGGRYHGYETVPVYNLVPSFGHTAELGFSLVLDEVPTHVVATVNPANDYSVDTLVQDIPTGSEGPQYTPLFSASLTLWGVPADPTHDAERGRECNFLATFGNECNVYPGGKSSDAPLTPFLTNPTSCTSGSLTTTLRVDSWQNPGDWLTYTATSPQPTGCEKLAFHPTLNVEPETTRADAPSGYVFRVKIPQDPNTYGLGTPELNNATVTLPQGLTIDPSAANGLAGCADRQIGIGTENPISCPPASKLGTVEVFTPLLANGPHAEPPLSGAIYLGTPVPGQEYRIFLAIEGHGVAVRLQGRIAADPVTGELTARFTENPPLPFNELVLRFFEGSKAALANPLTCGPAVTTSDLMPYGSPEVPDAIPTSTFDVSDCGNPPVFAPTLTAGTAPPSAGGYGTFSFQLARGDGQQYISQISSVSLPPGLLGNISSVPLCASAAAAAGTCGPLSEIGQVTVGAGPGPTPFYLPGRVYLTEGYNRDPFGLSIVVPAIAGPYNLGTVVVRAGIAVNSQTAAITVQADPVPTILEGIPLRLRYIGITIDRPSFILNPTNCAQQLIAASVDAQQGATASASSPFFASGCGDLPFNPVLAVSAPGGASSRGNGAGLTVRVAQAPGEANIKSVHVELPKLLPARLSTLNQACPEATFVTDRGSCPTGAVVGSAVAHTPLLPVALEGPVYFVSRGNKAFPELIAVLRGDGVTVDLAGETFIDSKTDVTSSTFASVPDAPITSFELRLPEQSNSALASPNGSLCGKTLTMPTSIEGQNGATVTQNTLIGVTGCTTAKAKPLTKAQELVKTLQACRKKPHKKKRAACEAQARKKYAAKTATSRAGNRDGKAGR
jgi:hypothetical protein